MVRQVWMRATLAAALAAGLAAAVMAPRALRAAPTATLKAAVLYALPSGGEETPSNTSPATAFGRFVLTPDRKQLLYEVHVAGLSGPATAMHLHMAARGVAGNVIIPLATPDDGEAVGCVDVPAGADAALLAQQMYLNIHTGLFPKGEIRGQAVPAP
jgi:hypothetical protein